MYNYTFKNYICENAIVKATILYKELRLKIKKSKFCFVFSFFWQMSMDIQGE